MHAVPAHSGPRCRMWRCAAQRRQRQARCWPNAAPCGAMLSACSGVRRVWRSAQSVCAPGPKPGANRTARLRPLPHAAPPIHPSTNAPGAGRCHGRCTRFTASKTRGWLGCRAAPSRHPPGRAPSPSPPPHALPPRSTSQRGARCRCCRRCRCPSPPPRGQPGHAARCRCCQRPRRRLGTAQPHTPPWCRPGPWPRHARRTCRPLLPLLRVGRAHCRRLACRRRPWPVPALPRARPPPHTAAQPRGLLSQSSRT